jgi:hypothetical protein
MEGSKSLNQVFSVSSRSILPVWATNMFVPKTTVLVNSLPFVATSEMLHSLFANEFGLNALQAYVVDEKKSKRMFHCGLVKLADESLVEIAITKINNYRLCGRNICVSTFDPLVNFEATKAGPIHFSFKAVQPHVTSISEELVRSSLEFCGEIIDVVIRQQIRSTDTNCICGFGFITFATIEDHISAVKFVYQRLIGDVVFDCQFSDVFQKSPEFTPAMRQLKSARRAYHHRHQGQQSPVIQSHTSRSISSCEDFPMLSSVSAVPSMDALQTQSSIDDFGLDTSTGASVIPGIYMADTRRSSSSSQLQMPHSSSKLLRTANSMISTSSSSPPQTSRSIASFNKALNSLTAFSSDSFANESPGQSSVMLTPSFPRPPALMVPQLSSGGGHPPLGAPFSYSSDAPGPIFQQSHLPPPSHTSPPVPISSIGGYAWAATAPINRPAPSQANNAVPSAYYFHAPPPAAYYLYNPASEMMPMNSFPAQQQQMHAQQQQQQMHAQQQQQQQMHAQQQQQQQMHAQQQQQQQQQQMHAQQKQQQQQQMHAQQHHFHPPLFQYQGQQAAQFSAGPIPYPTAQQPSFPHLTPASNNHATSIHYSQQQPPQHLYPSQHSHHPAHY